MNTNFKKSIFFLAVIATALSMSSCKSTMIIPQAYNTVNSVNFSELNLERKNYEVINTITAEATVKYENKWGQITIQEENSEFELFYRTEKDGSLSLMKYDGVLKIGSLTNDDLQGEPVFARNPESLARSLAIYRLINLAKEQGADGVIEPLVSTNVEQRGKEVYFQTTVSAKLVKIKVD